MTPKQYISLQLLIFGLIIIFGISLLAGWVKIPTGPEGEWFRSIWEIILAVGNIAGMVIHRNNAAPALPSAETET